MAIYDYQGNIISSGGEITDEEIRDAFLNAVIDGAISVGTQVGSTLPLDTHFFNETYMNTAYASLLAKWKLYPNSVPFFINSDQHGRGLEIQRYANNIDTDGMDYSNINMGDTVVDTYGSSFLEDAYQRIKYVKNYIGIVGNHEHKPSTTEDPEKYLIRKVFSTTNIVRKMISTDVVDCYVAYQPQHAVKYLCLDLYDHWDSNGSQPYTTSATAKWMIEELSKKDELDIVLLMHEPTMLTYKKRGDSSYTTMTQSANMTALFNLFLARKNKTSGTYTAADGTTHSYDFANTDSELLCMLSGHWHDEEYSDADGMTVYVQDWAGANKYGGSFGLIDRENNLLRIFSFDSVNGVKEELDITLQ